MFGKPRILAFVTFVKDHGVEKLLDILEHNEQLGIAYHHPGKLTGDYDALGGEAEILSFLERLL